MGEATGIWTTKVHQHPERAVPQRAQEFLAQGKVAHVGFVQDGRALRHPHALSLFARAPRPHLPSRRMSSRMLEELAKGIPVCVTVTELDGLVYSRDAKYHSANYRCVMCFGRGRIFEDEAAKRVMFEAMTSALLPRTHRRTRLHARAIVAPDLDRRGGSNDRGDQRQDARRRPQRPAGRRADAPGTCGVADV